MKLLVLTIIVGFSMAVPTLHACCSSCHTERTKCEERKVCKMERKRRCHGESKKWTHQHCKGMRPSKLNKNPHSSK